MGILVYTTCLLGDAAGPSLCTCSEGVDDVQMQLSAFLGKYTVVCAYGYVWSMCVGIFSDKLCQQ